jgi:ribosomal protein S1
MNFNELNTTELDKGLSPEERAEWNAIYASYRSESLLSGIVSGVDNYNVGGESMAAVVIIVYRVKVLIPEKLLWDENCTYISKDITKNLLGAKLDYVITSIDRENSVCVASRIAATRIKRKRFFRVAPKVGERVQCNVLAVGVKRIIVEVNGFDLQLKKQELCYSAYTDFRQLYSAGQTLTAVLTKANKRDNAISVSVREAKSHPYDGLQKRHPVNSRRTSVITGKFKGAVFCKLEDDFDCLCRYSNYHSDDDFGVGDRVIVIIKEYDDKQKRVYGVIVSKWR